MRQRANKSKETFKSSSESSSGNTPKLKLGQKYLKKDFVTKPHQGPSITTIFRAYFDPERHHFQSLETTCDQSSQQIAHHQTKSPITPNRVLEILLLNGISKRCETEGGDLLMELMKLEEVMAELKISRTTLWRLRQSGVIRDCRLGGLIWIARSDLNRFIRNEVLAGRAL